LLPCCCCCFYSSRFAEYRKDDPTSFGLHHNLTYYPQFMFNLRRSPFVQVFGFGPDETAYVRMILFKAPVLDAVVSGRGGRGVGLGVGVGTGGSRLQVKFAGGFASWQPGTVMRKGSGWAV
jgi:hypothetical protein